MKIVLTGGVYGGKTTTINSLKELGYEIVPEAAMQVITKLKEELGEIEQKRWMMANFTDFQTMNLERQLENEKKIKGDLVFFDRGLLDYFAFCELRGYETTDKMRQIINESKSYSKAFIFEVLDSFDVRPGSGRVMDRETAQRLVGITEKIYQESGCETIRVPNGTIQERIDFILSNLN